MQTYYIHVSQYTGFHYMGISKGTTTMGGRAFNILHAWMTPKVRSCGQSAAQGVASTLLVSWPHPLYPSYIYSTPFCFDYILLKKLAVHSSHNTSIWHQHAEWDPDFSHIQTIRTVYKNSILVQRAASIVSKVGELHNRTAPGYGDAIVDQMNSALSHVIWKWTRHTYWYLKILGHCRESV